MGPGDDESFGQSGDHSGDVSAVLTLQDLSQGEFGRWAADRGYGELSQILLFRWDPDEVVDDYPDSSTAYEDEARSIVLGARTNDEFDAFARRLRNKSRDRLVTHFSDEALYHLWNLVHRWMPTSITNWWRDHVMEQLRALPFHVHLIKYDPDQAIHHYDDGTWTSISDVGEPFNGVVLSMDDYLAIEQAHLDSIRAMAVECGASRFRVATERTSTMGLNELVAEVRSSLREEPGCGFWWTSVDLDFSVVVGYDYHVYVGSRVECKKGLDVAFARGLHPRVDEGPSPYLYR